MLLSFRGPDAAAFSFSCIFTNGLLLLFLMFGNLAGSQILGSHPLSLGSLKPSLYCLLVSGGAERAESRQIFPPLWKMARWFVLGACDLSVYP